MNSNDKIIFDCYAIDFQIGNNYIIEITLIISTPEYSKFTQFYDKKDEYGETFQDFYERKIIEEKIYKINLYITCHDQSIKTCNYPELTTKKIQNNSIDIIYFSNYIYRRETDNILNTYLNSINLDDNDYCNTDIIDNYEYNYMNECMNECSFSCYSLDCNFICGNENQYLFNSKSYDKCPEGTIENNKNGQKICKCKNLFYIDDNSNNICLSSKICDDNHPILNDKMNECLNYYVKFETNKLLGCPENTCISQRYWDVKICEEKSENMEIFNGICFDYYSEIIDNIDEMAENHRKIKNKKGIIISCYSYNNDYLNNFDKLIEDNSDSTIIDLREYIEEYKKKNNIGAKLIYIL